MIRPEKFTNKWPVRPLGEVVEFLDSQRRPVREQDRNPGDFPYYGANGQQGTIDDFIFDEPLILLAEDGGFFGMEGKTIAYRVSGKCWVNNHAHVLRPKKFMDLAFLCRQLETYDVTAFISGTTRGKLTKGSAEQIPILTPPLDEQRRIAAILDKADAIRRKRQESIRLTEEFLRSTFLKMFGDPVTNPKGWDKVPIKELGDVMTGNTPSREVQEYYGEGIEWIKSDNINTPFHFLTKAKEHLTPTGQTVGRIVPANSTLVTCIAGSPECIGNAALANRPVAFNQQINAVTPFKGTNPYFLYVHILISKKQIQGQSTESMKGMVSKGKFENILFLKPPIKQQEGFGKIFTHFHKMINKADSSNQESANLFNSLAQRAFRGEH